MTDLEKFCGLLKSFGISYNTRTAVLSGPPVEFIGSNNKDKFTIIKIKEGVGYGDFYGEFYFKLDGTFLTYGLWE